MKLSFAAAIAMVAFLAAPAAATDSQNEAPTLYSAENEFAQVAAQDPEESDEIEVDTESDLSEESDEELA